MSTVMYCHRIKKDNLWQFCHSLRNFYRENGVASQLLQSDSKMAVVMKEVVSNREHYVDLQLFEESNDFFLFRVLSCSYLFLNNCEEFDDIQSVFYDDRSDIPPEYEKNKVIADWVDAQISSRRYFIIPIIDKSCLLDRLFEIRKDKAKEKDAK